MLIKVLALITLSVFTVRREGQRSLPVIHPARTSVQATISKPSNTDAPTPMHKPAIDMQHITNELYKNPPPQYCYSFIRKRPRDQRATAVQARLEQADRMTAAFEPDLLTVDLIGDHANILSLEFPAAWPDESQISHVSSVVEEYFASVDIEDYMCGAGFAEVRLSARNVADQCIHPIWSARVTSEGLLKFTFAGQVANHATFESN
jgi:hypothetical protein